MAATTYRSEVRVAPGPGPSRTAWLPEGERLRFDPGDAVTDGAGRPAAGSRASTEIDYLVAATAG